MKKQVKKQVMKKVKKQVTKVKKHSRGALGFPILSPRES
jgi:hypothetical protein